MTTLSAISLSNNTHLVTLFTRRTYDLFPDGTCQLAKEQLPVREDMEPSEDPQQMEVLLNDTDCYPRKPYTDFILKGFAQTNEPLKQFKSGIKIGFNQWQVQIFGSRTAGIVNDRVYFSEPDPIQKVALDFTNAYGGVDPLQHPAYIEEMTNAFPDYPLPINHRMGSPFAYTRNTIGKGFIVGPVQSDIDIALPNLEDPDELLNPNNLICPSADQWHQQPLPFASSWVSPFWFPRSVYFGIWDQRFGYPKLSKEEKRSWAEPQLTIMKNVAQTIHERAANGAHPGLQFKNIDKGQTIELQNIFPNKPYFVFKLPLESPIMKVDDRKGGLKMMTNIVISTIELDTEKGQLSIVWRGESPAIRPYLKNELAVMPREVLWN